MVKWLLNVILFSLSLCAKDTLHLPILDKVISNTVIGLQLDNSHFYCSQYGIYGLDAFLTQEKVSPYCKDRVKEVLQRYPSIHSFTQQHLKLYQRYHVVFKEGQCQLFSDGPKSYAEVLVEKGIAVVEPKFKKRDYYYYKLQKAQRRAKIGQRGIWEAFGMDECIQSLYKE